jgi:PAS domain S-box-containing protein
MEHRFEDVVARARAAVTVKDDGGFCVYANRLAEVLRGAGPGELLGKHVLEMVGADPRLVARQFERFKQEGAWVGQYPTRSSTGDLVVQIRSYQFTHRTADDLPLYVSFAYPLSQHAGFGREGPARLGDFGLTALDACLLQFYVEGFSDEDVAVLLGVPSTTVESLLPLAIEAMGAKSKTEACVRAMKKKLAV